MLEVGKRLVDLVRLLEDLAFGFTFAVPITPKCFGMDVSRCSLLNLDRSLLPMSWTMNCGWGRSLYSKVACLGIAFGLTDYCSQLFEEFRVVFLKHLEVLTQFIFDPTTDS